MKNVSRTNEKKIVAKVLKKQVQKNRIQQILPKFMPYIQ